MMKRHCTLYMEQGAYFFLQVCKWCHNGWIKCLSIYNAKMNSSYNYKNKLLTWKLKTSEAVIVGVKLYLKLTQYMGAIKFHDNPSREVSSQNLWSSQCCYYRIQENFTIPHWEICLVQCSRYKKHHIKQHYNKNSKIPRIDHIKTNNRVK